jgi:hypothetical protein
LRRGADAIWRGKAGGSVVELHPETPDFLLDMHPTAAASSDALLAIADKLLDSAGTLSGDDSDDLVIALATLGWLDAKLPVHLESRATGPSSASALARAALARYRSASQAQETVRPGTGWKNVPGNLGAKSEAVPKR